MIQECGPEEFRELIIQHLSGNQAVLLDVRSMQEFKFGHIQGAISLPAGAPDLQKKIDSYDKNLIYLVYCHSGVHSKRIISYMENTGFKKIFHLTQGLAGWTRAGLEVEI